MLAHVLPVAPAEGNPRMMGMQNLPELHAALHSIARLAWPFGLARGQSVGLPEGACSHMFCLSLLRRALPNGRMVEPVSSARGAGNRFARRRMLAQPLLAAPAEGNTRMMGGGACQFCARRYTRLLGLHSLSALRAVSQSACHLAHALPFSASKNRKNRVASRFADPAHARASRVCRRMGIRKRPKPCLQL